MSGDRVDAQQLETIRAVAARAVRVDLNEPISNAKLLTTLVAQQAVLIDLLADLVDTMEDRG